MRSVLPLFLLAQTPAFHSSKNIHMKQTTYSIQDFRAFWRGETRVRAESSTCPKLVFTSVPCFSPDELTNKLSLPGWLPGVGLHYQDLCFIRTDYKETWYVYRGKSCFTTVWMPAVISQGRLNGLVDQFLTTPPEKLALQDFASVGSNEL